MPVMCMSGESGIQSALAQKSLKTVWHSCISSMFSLEGRVPLRSFSTRSFNRLALSDGCRAHQV